MEDEELILAPKSFGLSTENAERIVAFLSIAFSRAVIKRIGNVRFSSHYRIRENGRVPIVV